MRRLSQQATTRTAPTITVYLRYSDEDNQRFSSIEDQNRKCREAALAKGLVFDSSLVFVDAGLSGETCPPVPVFCGCLRQPGRCLESSMGFLNHLINEVLRPELLEFTINKFHQALKHQLQILAGEAKNKRAALPSLKREKRLLERNIKTAAESLLNEGSSKALRAKLNSLEARCWSTLRCL
jgi:hypothetical protein